MGGVGHLLGTDLVGVHISGGARAGLNKVIHVDLRQVTLDAHLREVVVQRLCQPVQPLILRRGAAHLAHRHCIRLLWGGAIRACRHSSGPVEPTYSGFWAGVYRRFCDSHE